MATKTTYNPSVLPSDHAGTFDHLVAHGHIVNQGGKHVRLYQQQTLTAILYGPSANTQTPLHLRLEYEGFRKDVFEAIAPYVQKKNIKPDSKWWDYYTVTDWAAFNQALWPLIATRRIRPKDWSDAELKATIDAYQWMSAREQSAERFSKAKVNSSLRKEVLSGRSAASIEFRMRNISAVMQDLNQPILGGYLPAKHVGEDVKKRITRLLLGAVVGPKDFEPTADEAELDQRTARLRKSGLVTAAPPGTSNPKKSTSERTTIERDPKVKAWILQEAHGHCECCDEPAPFETDDGLPFLEVHHVLHLADGGPDKASNAVAVCPNCHRALHHSRAREKLIEKLISNIQRLRE